MFRDVSRGHLGRVARALEQCFTLRQVRWRPFSVEAAAALYSAQLAAGAVVIWYLNSPSRVQDFVTMEHPAGRFGGAYLEDLPADTTDAVLKLYSHACLPDQEAYLSLSLSGRDTRTTSQLPPLTHLRIKGIACPPWPRESSRLRVLELHDCLLACVTLDALMLPALEVLELTGKIADVTADHLVGLGCLGLRKLVVWGCPTFQLTPAMFQALEQLEQADVNDQVWDAQVWDQPMDLRDHKALRMLDVRFKSTKSTSTPQRQPFLVSRACVCLVWPKVK
jgi:hypothetical protein